MRQAPLWRNALAVALPVGLGIAGTAFAAWSACGGSANIYDFVRLQAFFMTEPITLMTGLIVAEVMWRY